jgi:arylsulfatase A-like enzyme
MMGSHRLLAKTVMYEEAVKVPWLIRIPDLGRRQRIVRERVSHIDLVPSLLKLMGQRPEASLPGSSLVPLIEGGRPAEDHVFIEWNPFTLRNITPHSISTVSREDVERVNSTYTRAVISPEGWKLCLSDRDKSQLFNLNEDPWETTNLFDSGRHRGVIGALSGRIHRWQERVGDIAEV